MFVVLAGDDHIVDTHGLAVHVFHGDLGFAVGPQEIKNLVLAHVGQPPGQLVGPIDRRRHEGFRLRAGEAEHHALIARTLFLGLLAHHALGDVRRLLVHRGDDRRRSSSRTHIRSCCSRFPLTVSRTMAGKSAYACVRDFRRR